MRSIKGKELMKLEKWDKRGSRDPDHHEGCMVSRLLGERRNLDRAQIDQKMRSIRGEQALSAVYNTPIIYSGFQIRALVGKPFSPFNSHPKHMLWVLKKNRLNETVLSSTQNTFLILVRKKYVVGTKKNHFIETVLLST